MSVALGPVVEDFNLTEDTGPGQSPGFADPFADPLFIQRIEERFGHGIIPAIATTTHARRQCWPDRSAATRCCRTGYPGPNAR